MIQYQSFLSKSIRRISRSSKSMKGKNIGWLFHLGYGECLPDVSKSMDDDHPFCMRSKFEIKSGLSSTIYYIAAKHNIFIEWDRIVDKPGFVIDYRNPYYNTKSGWAVVSVRNILFLSRKNLFDGMYNSSRTGRRLKKC